MGMADTETSTKYSKVLRPAWITRDMLRENPFQMFLFGDNLKKVGMAGQAAAMRGEPNAVGIPTKRAPSNDPSAFFRDSDIDELRKALWAAFKRPVFSLAYGGTLVIPKDGLGTGLSRHDRGRDQAVGSRGTGKG
jgi:hypothetical protein